MFHLYKVYDGGEIYQYAAKSPDNAASQHRQFNTDCGVSEEEYSVDAVELIPDATVITIRDAGDNGEAVTKTAAEWASDGPGQVGSTAY